MKINSHVVGLVEKIGGLGLVDPEAAKTSLLCKKIVKALELGEYDLQLILRYRMARLNPRRGRCLGINLDCFTSKQHRGFSSSKALGHEKSWLQASTTPPPAPTLMDLLHCNVWWSYGLKLIDNGFTYAKADKLYHKGIQCVDNIWDSEHRTFLSWNEAQISSISLQRRMSIGSHLRPRSLTNGGTY